MEPQTTTTDTTNTIADTTTTGPVATAPATATPDAEAPADPTTTEEATDQHSQLRQDLSHLAEDVKAVVADCPGRPRRANPNCPEIQGMLAPGGPSR